MKGGFVSFKRLAAAVCVLALGAGAAWAAGSRPVAQYLGALHWRQVGPYRGGRVDSVTGVVGHPNVYYFGAAAGGIFKTVDGGHHWQPLFQHEPVSAVGAIAVSASAPNVVYAGTGEAALRSNISAGDGVYKSTDGGRTWKHMGLDKTRHIARISVQPGKPKHVLVAALGSIYKKNDNGGIYLSTDGGTHWKKVLYVNDRTGGVDLARDPDNPRIVYAATWEVWRKPWILHSGGPGSGIYKSTDGGRSWKKLSGHGLPTGTLGRIGLTVSKNDGGRQVYAIIEAKDGGIYRSDDGGGTWKHVNDRQLLMQRPFYFMNIFADPGDPDTVYVLDRGFFKSTDQGYHFDYAAMQGGDNHDLWINPQHPRFRIEGNDQGAVISTDGGKSWTKPYNEPIAQMYHVNVDDQYPYNLYGEQQDSGSLIMPSMSFAGRICGFTTTVGGGESGFVLPQPGHPNVVFADTYMGQLTRYNRKTKELKQVSPWPYDSHGEPASEQKYRFTWVAPLAFSPQSPDVLYMGSQVLFKSTDSGQSWKAISPDLTRNDKSKQGPSGGPITKDQASAEYYDLIYAVAPSPKQAGEIWVGTDDGLVWLTRDGGKHWHKVTPHGIPKWGKIAMIEASPFKAGTAYLVVDAHKLGVRKPFIYRTRDYGRQWRRITAGIPGTDYVHVVRADPVKPGLLYAGTEHGVYVSFDDGGRWHPLQLNLPASPVHDLVVHDNDLIAATFGRGYWILDDVAPLRQFSDKVARSGMHLYQPVQATRFQIKGGGCPHGISGGKNPPLGAIVDYYLKSRPRSARLQITDSQGHVVRTFTWSAQASRPSHAINPPEPHSGGGLRSVQPHSSAFKPHAGLNRLVWNLRYQPLRKIPGEVYQEADGIAPMVLPGTYTVKLTVDGKSSVRKIKVRRNPLADSSLGDLKEQNRFLTEIYHTLDHERKLVGTVQALQKRVDAARSTLSAQGGHEELETRLKRIAGELKAVNHSLHSPDAHADEELFNHPVGLDQQLAFLDYVVASGDHAPTAQSHQVYRVLTSRFGKTQARWHNVLQQIKAVNESAHHDGLGLIVAPPGGH